MVDFLLNVFKIFLTIVVVGIPASIFITCLLFEYLYFCSTIAGIGGVLIGFFLLISILFAALISY